MHTPTILRQLAALAALAASAAAVAAAANPGSTVISSIYLEMQGTADRNYFYFSGNVEVLATNLQLRCDELTVVSLREGPEGVAIGEIGAIEKIVASGNVRIQQAGRSAYAGRAEVDPRAGTVVLSDKPRIVDDEVEVEGYQFVLHKGEKKFESIPDPLAPANRPSRSVVRLGSMPDLGFDQDAEKVTVDDRLKQDPPAQPQPAPAQEGGPDGGQP